MDKALEIIQGLHEKAQSENTKQDLATLEEYVNDLLVLVQTLQRDLGTLKTACNKLELFKQHVALGFRMSE